MMDREERREEGERIEEQMELKEDRKVGSRTERKEDGKMEERMALEIDSISRNEEFARVVVAVFMSRMNPTLEEVDDVKTAVSEAVTNAVIHGFGQKKRMIYIVGKFEGNELTVVVKDLGIGIDNLKKAMEPMYTSDPSGERSGMGFSFMEAFMDQLEVESQPGKGTLVRMKKRIGG